MAAKLRLQELDKSKSFSPFRYAPWCFRNLQGFHNFLMKIIDFAFFSKSAAVRFEPTPDFGRPFRAFSSGRYHYTAAAVAGCRGSGSR